MREDAKNRIAGFEILPAALVIGDLHLRRVLRRLGAPLKHPGRPALYLTNSLLGWFPDSFPPQGALPWVAAERESAAANRYKQKADPVLVVLGNLPSVDGLRVGRSNVAEEAVAAMMGGSERAQAMAHQLTSSDMLLVWW